jgi:hypothetical protein
MGTFIVIMVIVGVTVAIGAAAVRKDSGGRGRPNRSGGYYDAGGAVHTSGYSMGSHSSADSGSSGDCGPGEPSSSGYSDSGSSWSGGDSGGSSGGDSGGGGGGCD